MSSRGGFLSDVSWFQVTASAAAAVTAAWLASSLGVAGTLIGAALGSFVVTISTAFYGRTLDKGKTLIVQTASGTTVEKTVHEGEIAEAFHEVEEAEGSPVLGAEVVEDVEDGPRRLRWKRIILTALMVLAISIGAMGAYEVVTDNSFGASTDNPRIGNPFGGGSGSSSDTDDEQRDDDPDEPEPSSTPTPQRSTATPTPAPSTATPAPAATTPAPTPTPSATVPTPSATPTVPAE